MGKDLKGKTVEWFNKKIDDAPLEKRGKDRGGPLRDWDARLLKSFPFFVAGCVAAFVIFLLLCPKIDLQTIFKVLCVTFVIGFTLLGVVCLFMIPQGVFSNWILFLFAALVSLGAWMFCSNADEFFFTDGVTKLLEIIGIHVSAAVGDLLGYLGALAVMFLAPIGVCTVVSAYLRKYIPVVLNNMCINSRDGVRRGTEKFFLVPTIIDVKDIVLEPKDTGHKFRFDDAVSIMGCNMILCIFIASYIFLTPFFLDHMDWMTMLSVALMLSMFVPVLILIWQLFRILGAKVVSDAPRKYDLWEGGKRRLYSTFVALGLLMTMFLVVLYLGYDMVHILQNYLVFMVPLFGISIIYGMLYANNFADRDVKSISDRFEELKGKVAEE